jgi:hypothetical protein
VAEIAAARNIAIETLDDYYTGRETSAHVLAAALEGIVAALKGGA